MITAFCLFPRFFDRARRIPLQRGAPLLRRADHAGYLTHPHAGIRCPKITMMPAVDIVHF